MTGQTRYARFLESSPLRHRAFRLFYAGSVGVALGYTMQANVSAWLMATLTPSALMVALVQTASTAPSLLFGLAAGALADIVDRRKIILVTQVLLVVATGSLGVATLAGIIGPIPLLVLTFITGVGFTFYMPAQQASINDLVSREDIPRAIGLGAVAFNVSRAVGPALGGAIAALLGTGSAIVASALFFVIMVFSARGWRSPAPAIPGVPETVISGIAAGLRYARHSPPLLALILRNFIFSICASGLWALLAVIARDQLKLGAGGFGLLSACFGAGAVAGAMTMPRLLRRMSLNTLVSAGSVLWAVAILLIASTHITAIALVGATAAGIAWVGVLSGLASGTQSTVPAWVRARAVSMTLIAVQASLALGSILWGTVAAAVGTQIALAASAGLMLLLLALTYRVRVSFGDESDVTPGVQLPDLVIAVEPKPDDGPVLIQLDYQIDVGNRAAFLRDILAVEPTRLRNGAVSWRLFRDLQEDGRFIERFIIASWAEYVRLRMRMTMADREIQDRVTQFQRKNVEVRISRLIGVTERDIDLATDEKNINPP